MKYLFLLPFIGLLWVPFYNFENPYFLGLPFFYWYQFLWIPVTSFIAWLNYRNYYTQEDEQ